MKPIIFTGDSFTFGEGLELHDDVYRDFIHKKCMQMEELKKQGKPLNWDDTGYLWHQYSDFSENIVPAGKLRYELSYPALVSNHFNTLGFRKFNNGGNQKVAIEFIERCIGNFSLDSFSIAIINLTSLSRDELYLLIEHFKQAFNIDITDKIYNNNDSNSYESTIPYLNQLFLTWETLTENNKKRFKDDIELFESIKNKIYTENPNFISLDDAQKLQDIFKDWDGWIEGITTLYYKEYIKLLDKIEIPYYFIPHWSKFDAKLLESIDDDEITKKIKNKTIPIYKKGIETSLAKEWNTDFYLHNLYPWSENKHPSKYGHKIIADSIIKFIEENKL